MEFTAVCFLAGFRTSKANWISSPFGADRTSLATGRGRGLVDGDLVGVYGWSGRKKQ